MKKKVLVISWFFPPINSSEGLVTYKLLNNSKLEYDVYTQYNNESWSYGKSDELIIGKNINCIRSKTTNMDEFKDEVIEYFKKNKNKYDIVMTRSMAEVAHVIGLEIKSIKPSIIWIASFGDPIGNNPFTLKAIDVENPYSLKQRYVRPMGIKEMISPVRALKSMLYKRRYRRNYKLFIKDNNTLQSNIINNCDYVIYNSENQKNYMLKDYYNKDDLDKKTVVLPHSYDDKLYSHKTTKHNKIIFSFVGHLDEIRNPRVLFEALVRLKKHDENLAQKVEFNFYGNMGDQDKLFIINNDLTDIVRIRKPVNYLESLRVMEDSDWLIHIDANILDLMDENIFFAAKIADYIGSKSKVMGITMINGISADILRNYNALCLEKCADEVFNYLYLIIYENYSREMNYKYRKEFDAKNIAKTFDTFIDSISKEA